MVNIVDVCFELESKLCTKQSKEDVLTSCIKQKLNTLYTIQSEQLDSVLSELDKCLEKEDIQHTCTVIRKLSKVLSCNRKQLWKLLEEVSNNGQV